jgi:RNA polymerase sigma factor (sigma-70 family)
MNTSEAIILYRPMLQGIAEKLVGCTEEAEDIVQDTFLKWLSVEQEKIENTKAYLIKAVTNNCLSHIQRLKKKKEDLISSFDSLQISNWHKEHDFFAFDMENELSAAMFIIQSKLEPLERALFILKEAFNIDYDTLQEVFEKKKDHCRQLVCRARKKINESTPNLNITFPNSNQLLDKFLTASNLNNAAEFISHLRNELYSSTTK